MRPSQTNLKMRLVFGFFLIYFLTYPIEVFTAHVQKKDYSPEKILNNIYVSCGYFLKSKPKIKITQNSIQAAVFQPSSNTILLDAKLIRICRSFNHDSTQALAFIIAHELSHAIYKDKSSGLVPTNFLNYSSNFRQNEREEKLADIQGAFMAYLAGYDPSKVLSILIEKIYKSYNLSDSPQDNYPSLNERKQTTKLVLEQVDNLISVFETSNILTAKGEYELATAGYNYILQFYRGPEVLNNFGINMAMQALTFFNEETDQYIFPFELDANSFLKKIRKARGPLPIEDQLRRQSLIGLAKKAFNEAIIMNPNKLAYHINLMSCILLEDQPKKCNEYFIKHGLEKYLTKKINAENLKLNLILGICQARLKKSPNNPYFDRVLLSDNVLLKSMAAYNKNINLNLQLKEQKSATCRFPLIGEVTSNKLTSESLNALKKLKLSKENLCYSFGQLKTSNISLFSNETGDILSINRFSKSDLGLKGQNNFENFCLEDPEVSIVLIGKKQLVFHVKYDVVYELDESGNVSEIIWFKYY